MGKSHCSPMETDLNPDYHVEVTFTIAEIREFCFAARDAEKELARLSAERKRLETELGDPAVYADAARAAALARRQGEVATALDAAEEAWLAAAEALEAAERD